MLEKKINREEAAQENLLIKFKQYIQDQVREVLRGESWLPLEAGCLLPISQKRALQGSAWPSILATEGASCIKESE